ncbi:hypothetical protein Tco_1233599 [Tanacetum coccineum]
MTDAHLSTRLGYAVQTALQSYTAKFEKEAQAEKDRYIDLIEKSIKDIIKDEVKSQLPQILPKEVSDFATSVIQSTITESLENVILAKSSSQPQSIYEAAASLTEEFYDALVKSYKLDKDLFKSYGKEYSLKRDHEDKDKDEDPPPGSYQGLKRRKTNKDTEPSKRSKSKESKSSSSKGTKSQPKSSEKPPLTFAELMSTPINFSAYVMNNMKIENLTQEHLLDQPSIYSKGHVEVEWNSSITSKSVIKLSLIDLTGIYPFDLSKPLPLVKDRGGSSSKKYMTSTTKTKAAKYDDIQGIKDMVPKLWSPVKMFTRRVYHSEAGRRPSTGSRKLPEEA